MKVIVSENKKLVNEINENGPNYFDCGDKVRYNGNQIYTVIDWRRDFAKGIIVYDIQPEGEKDAEILKKVPEDDLGELEETMQESKKVVKESYEISDELKDRLNSILADEFLASEAYRLAIVAMKGNKQHRLTEIAEKNGKDELEDHFKNLSDWMQSKGMTVVTDTDEMKKITNGTVLKFPDGMSTTEIIDQLILSEEEAIAVYEDTIPHTELDLNVMLCGFLKDEREHLKELVDCRDEMGGGDKAEEAKKPNIFEGKMVGESDQQETITFTASNIEWDVSDGDLDWSVSDKPSLPEKIDVPVPVDVVDMGSEAVEDFISDYITDATGYCHNGFSY